MSQLRIAKTLNAEDCGDLREYFKTFDKTIKKNSGIHDNKCLVMDCLEPQCPFGADTYVKLKMTDESIDVTNIDKSWINMRISFNLNIKSIISYNNNTPCSDQCLFVGFKSSNQIISGYRILNKNMKTGCEQPDAIYESTTTYFLKPEQEINGRPNVYSTWKAAFGCDEFVCGTYIDIPHDAPLSSTSFNCEFDLNIPFDDILALSGFTMYPNYLFGNLQIEIKTAIERSLVICQCDPYAVLFKTKTTAAAFPYLKERTISALVNRLKQNHRFFNIGERMVLPLETYNKEAQEFSSFGFIMTTSVSDFQIISCSSHINGFKIKQEIKDDLKQKYTKSPLIVASQLIDHQVCSGGLNKTNLNATASYSLTNVSNIFVTFPRTGKGESVSINPGFDTFQLFVDNEPYPQRIDSSTSSSYAEYCLSNSYLDSLWSSNETLTYSLLMNPHYRFIYDHSPHDDPVYYGIKDYTNYVFNIATERLCGGKGIYCDGLNKDISLIRIVGTTSSGNYYFKEAKENDLTSPPPPSLCFVQTCFWLCSPSGVRFISNDKDFVHEYEQQPDDDDDDEQQQ